MWTRRILGLGVVAMVLVLAACGGGQISSSDESAESAAPDGAALLQERCTSCHGLDRTTSERKTQDAWNDTVTRMVEKGAKLSAEEQTALVEYLAATYGE